MPKKKKKPKEKKAQHNTNRTREKLSGTPFSSASEYNIATERILKSEWEQLERARARKELLKRGEFSYIIKHFESGLSCEFGNSKNKLFRIYIDKDGSTQVALDERMKAEKNNEALIGVLIKSLSETFEIIYLKAMKILPDTNPAVKLEDDLLNRS